MPEELFDWIIEQPDEVLLKMLEWIRKDRNSAIEELEYTVSRQAPSNRKRREE